jgi:hypothetical protein
MQLAQTAHEIIRNRANVVEGRCEVIQAEGAHYDLPHPSPLLLHQRHKRFGTKELIEVSVDYGDGFAVAAAVESYLHMLRP